MNPTLSARLRGWQQDPYWRVHRPAPWAVPMEPATALLHLPAVPAPAVSPAAKELPAVGSAVGAPVAAEVAGEPRSSPGSQLPQLIRVLILALVTLLEGWRAVRLLSRQIRAIWLAPAAGGRVRCGPLQPAVAVPVCVAGVAGPS